MKFSEFFTSKDNIQLDKKTLVILRWIALVGQYLTISIVYFIFKFELLFIYCTLIIVIGVFTNLYLQFKFNKNQLNNFASTFFLFYDLIQLSLLLYLTGGITNPFVILLIVPAIVASTFLTLGSTINLSIITIVILIVLTTYNLPLPHSGELHFHVPETYLYSIPIAIIITLIFLTYFGVRFGIESRKRTEALNKLELILAKEHELESIGLQAAAAAHSLGTPLSTITVVSRELEKEIGKNPKYAKDIDLLLSQTKRCSEILKNLSKDQLQEDNFLSDIKIEELLNEIVRSFTEISEKKLSLIVEKNQLNPQIDRTLEITYGLRNFIGNAVKYSNSSVDISLESNNKITEVKVCDDGPGFSEDILNVLGEPYIRSKNKIISSKSGLGLGTFIGKTLLERMRANVQFDKCPKTNGAMVTIKWQTKDLLAI
jgi:two-component system sensor histidine kinase RegB|tara:strand:+ start:55 stop:1341 length:1287 start_codon:yes stop_codon:yes gene_type:complete